MPNQENVENDVSLSDYIRVVLKKRMLILAVFFVAVIIAAVMSFSMPDIYHATAAIMIMPSKMQIAIFAAELGLDLEKESPKGEYLSQQPIISLPTHKMLLKSNTVLERIIDKLKLTDKSGNKLIPNILSKRLSVKEVKETNILQLETENSDPRITQEIVNNWAQEYVRYSQELISGEVGASGDFIAEQFILAKQNLIQTEEKVKDFKDKYKIDLMQAELNIEKEKLINEKRELADLEITLKTKEDSLKELQKEIEKQEKFIVVSKAITDDALWQKEGKGKDLSDLDERKLSSEEINPTYQKLDIRIVDTKIELNTLRPKSEYLKKSIETTGKRIDELNKAINQRKLELAQLIREVEIYKRTYDKLSIRVEEARIAKAMQLGEVKIVSFAIEPKKPIKPKRIQNVAIFGVLGLMLGVFIAFFQEFWAKKNFEGKISN